MRKVFFLLLSLPFFFIFSLAIMGEDRSLKWEELLLKAKNENKLLILKFYTITCPYCKKLNKEVYTGETISKLSKLAEIIDVNLSNDNGKVLREKYFIRGVPTTIIFNEKGEEIDRIIGYENREDYLKNLLLLIFDINTISDLKKRYSKEKDPSLSFEISKKAFDRGSFDEALEFLNRTKDNETFTKTNKENIDLLEGKIYLFKDTEKGINILKNLLNSSNRDIVEESFWNLRKHFLSKEDYKSLFEIHEILLKKNENDPDLLESYAYYLSKYNGDLNKALVLAQKAVSLSDESVDKLETLSEIYFKKQDYLNAIKTIEKAISKEPENGELKAKREEYEKEFNRNRK